MRTSVAIVAVAGLAAVSAAELPEVRLLVPGVDFTLSCEVVDDGGVVNPAVTGMSYDALAFGGTVTETNVNPGGSIIEDYVSIQSDTDYLKIHRFVGGVAVANNVLEWRFFNAGGNFVGGYGIPLPTPGLSNVWTITILSDLLVPKEGFLAMTSPVSNTGLANWRKKDVAPAIGTTVLPTHRWNMEVSDVPTPGALAVMGLGGLVAARRRR